MVEQDTEINNTEELDTEQLSFFSLSEADVDYDYEKRVSVAGDYQGYQSENAYVFEFEFIFNPIKDRYNFERYASISASDFSLRWVSGGGSTGNLRIAYTDSETVETQGNITKVKIKKGLTGIAGSGIPEITLTLHVAGTDFNGYWSGIDQIITASDMKLSKEISNKSADNKLTGFYLDSNNSEAIYNFNKGDCLLVHSQAIDNVNKINATYNALYCINDETIYETLESYENKKLNYLYPWARHTLISGKQLSAENIEKDGFYLDIYNPDTQDVNSFVPLIVEPGTKPNFRKGYHFGRSSSSSSDYKAIALVTRDNQTRIYVSNGYSSNISISGWRTSVEKSKKVLLRLQAGGSGGMASLWAAFAGADGRGGGGGAYGVFMLDVENRDYIIKIGKGGARGTENWGSGGAGGDSVVTEYLQNSLNISKPIDINQTTGKIGSYVLHGGTAPYAKSSGGTEGGEGGLPDASDYKSNCLFKVIYTVKGGNGSPEGTGRSGDNVTRATVYNTSGNKSLTYPTDDFNKIQGATYTGGHAGDSLSGAGGASANANGADGGNGSHTYGFDGSLGSGGGGARYAAMAVCQGGLGGDGFATLYGEYH